MKKVLILGIGKHANTIFSNEKYFRHLQEYIEIVGICDNNPEMRGKDISFAGRNWEIREVLDFNLTEIDAILCPVVVETYDKIQEYYKEDKLVSSKLYRFDLYIHNLLYTIETRYALSVVLIAKNESEYIREWLEFHRLVGVEHFYIYDNNSTDAMPKLLKEYIEQGLVTYTPWDKRQMDAYNDAIAKYKNETKYMAFIDADEFLFAVQEDSLVSAMDKIVAINLKQTELLREVEQCGGIGAIWRLYGTSGHVNKPHSGLLIENYTYRRDEDPHIKSIVNPRMVSECFVHHVKYYPGFRCISENGSPIYGPFFYDGKGNKLRINHYYTKSEEEFYEKIKKGRTQASSEKDTLWKSKTKQVYEELLKLHNDCKIYDPILAVRFAEKLKNNLSKE